MFQEMSAALPRLPRGALSIRLLAVGLVVAALGSCGGSQDMTPAAQGETDPDVAHLRSGSIALDAATTAAFLSALRETSTSYLHGLARFTRQPSPAEREILASLGFTVLSPLGGRVYRIRAANSWTPSDSAGGLPVAALALLRPEDRVAPEIWRGDQAAAGDSSLRITVVLEESVSDSQARQLFANVGGAAQRLSDGYWSITTTRIGRRRLSQSDIVRWIDAAAAPAMVDNDNTRAELKVNSLQSFSLGLGLPTKLGGKGVQVGVFDEGIDEGHDDLRIFTLGFSTVNRVIVTDPSQSYHGTLIAGIIAASGARSSKTDDRGMPNGGGPFQWRGMAPQAELLEGLLPGTTGGGEFSGSILRDFIVLHKMDLSNHSYELPGEGSGKYKEGSAERDAMIRGDATAGGLPIPARLQVFSAGNKGGWSSTAVATGEGVGYFSLNKGVKNGLVVGSWRSSDDRVVGSSSLGPTYDGRIKPDVVAPGSNVKSTGYWLPGTTTLLCTNAALATTTFIRRQFYATDCGTSLAAAAVSGVLALLLQQYAETYAANLDARPPLPSTLRGLIIHSAEDIARPEKWFTNGDGDVQALPGPDFVTGYGLVNARAANDLILERRIRHGELAATCDARTYEFEVPTQPLNIIGEPSARVRVTLAWDDLAGDPSLPPASARLVNDLDLVLIDPAGTMHYPWVLNQTIKAATDGAVLTPDQQTCGSSIVVEPQHDPSGPFVPVAAVKGPDHLNNVELVEAPWQSGTWKALVSGFSMPFGPQRYSLIGIEFPRPFPIIYDVTHVCQVYASFCQSVLVRLCDRYPEICRGPRTIPWGPIGPRLEFLALEDRIVLPVREVLDRLEVPEPGEGGDVISYEIGLGPAPMSVAIYTGAGVRVADSGLLIRPTTLAFRPDRGLTYFLVVAPGAGMAIVRPYDLPLTMRALRR